MVLALNLSILDAGILIMVHQVRLMMFLLNMVNYTHVYYVLPLTVHLQYLGPLIGGYLYNNTAKDYLIN